MSEGGGEGQGESAGRPGYHDPTAGWGGAAPARSALTFRLVLAGVGVVAFVAVAVLLAVYQGPPILLAIAVLLAVVGLIDIAVILRRKRRGEPG